MMSDKLPEIRAFLLKNLGLEYGANRNKELYTKLSSAIEDFGFETTEKFIDWLLANKPEKEQLKKLATFLTIGETYFFREQKALDFLEFQYLPELISERKNTSKTLKIWSAGCSSGEEPYSLAILLNRLIKDTDWNIKILATDINPTFINKAKKGIYTKWSFRKTSDEFQQTYFDKIGLNQFQIKDWIKNRVEFKFLNIASDDFPSVTEKIFGFDVILCRNVLIYFSQEGIKNVASKFYKTLVPGGIFLVSPVEASTILNSEFSHFMYQGISIFQKTGAKGRLNFSDKPNKSKTPGKLQIQPNRNLFVGQKIQQNKKIAVVKPAKNKATIKGKPGVLATPKLTENNNKMLAGVKAKANNGELQLAENLCLQMLKNDKLNEEIYFLLASIYNEMGENSKAIATLERILFLNPEYVMAHFVLGEILIKTDYNSGLRHFKNALKNLAKRNPDEIVENSDGITVKGLEEIIHSLV